MDFDTTLVVKNRASKSEGSIRGERRMSVFLVLADILFVRGKVERGGEDIYFSVKMQMKLECRVCCFVVFEPTTIFRTEK